MARDGGVVRIERRTDGGVRVHAFGRSARLPRSRAVRMSLAALLMSGGLLWFLPVLGLWMVPLGLLVLAVDHPPAERLAKWMVARGRHARQRARARLRRRGPGTP